MALPMLSANLARMAKAVETICWRGVISLSVVAMVAAEATVTPR